MNWNTLCNCIYPFFYICTQFLLHWASLKFQKPSARFSFVLILRHVNEITYSKNRDISLDKYEINYHIYLFGDILQTSYLLADARSYQKDINVMSLFLKIAKKNLGTKWHWIKIYFVLLVKFKYSSNI